MADLFLHLPFARRLRLAEGLHPLIGETLARRQALVALGATLPLLPGVERKGMSFFRRLFSGGGEAARWQKQLAATSSPRVELVKRFIVESNASAGHGALGPMSRLALGLGVLSHELLENKLANLVTSQSATERQAIERAQARLWLQAAVPNNLDVEWKVVGELADGDLHKRTLEHIDAALKAAFGTAPGRDALHRWTKGLVVEVTPAVQQGLPPSLTMQDHAARGPHFENNGFVGHVQASLSAFVLLANRLGERATAGTLDAVGVVEALCGPGGSTLLEVDPDAAGQQERWTSWQVLTRKNTLERGRNDKPAFIEGSDVVKPVHRSNAFTGMMNLADIPQAELPPAHQNGELPPPSQVLSPPMPAQTMEMSLAAIAGIGDRPPLPLDASGPVPVAPPLPLPKPPALTQEISLAQIEGEMRGFQAPALTQEISMAQIEGEMRTNFSAPALTQEISMLQIESTAPVTDPPAPAAAPDDNNAAVAPPSLPPEPSRE